MATIYVRPSANGGSDLNPGTFASPKETIKAAVTAAGAGGEVRIEEDKTYAMGTNQVAFTSNCTLKSWDFSVADPGQEGTLQVSTTFTTGWIPFSTSTTTVTVDFYRIGTVADGGNAGFSVAGGTFNFHDCQSSTSDGTGIPISIDDVGVDAGDVNIYGDCVLTDDTGNGNGNGVGMAGSSTITLTSGSTLTIVGFDRGIQGSAGGNKSIIVPDDGLLTIKNSTAANGEAINVPINAGTLTLRRVVVADRPKGIYLTAVPATATLTNITVDTIAGTGLNLTLVGAVNFVNSIVSNCTLGTKVNAGSTLTIDYCDYYNCTSDFNTGTDPITDGGNNIDADPTYVDAATDDYRIPDSSPCAGTGEAGVDMGAYDAVTFTPGTPVLVTPTDTYAYLTENGVRLTWTAGSGATPTSYKVYFDAVDGSTLYQSGVTNTYIDINSLTLRETYYWTVKATNAAGDSSAAAVWSFSVMGTGLLAERKRAVALDRGHYS